MTLERLVTKNHRFYYGWVIVAVMALASFTQSAETFPVISVFLKPMTAEFGWSRSAFTGSVTIGTLVAGALALGIGPIIDKFGSRWILVISFSLLGGTLILMASITNLWQFYVLQIIGRTLNMGVISLATMVVIPKWFVKKRGRAVAVGQLGLRAGNAVTPLYVQYLVSSGGWRIATIAAGLVMWIFSLLPSAFFLRRKPEDMGLLPDGEKSDSSNVQEIDQVKKKDIERPDNEVSLTLRQVSRLPSFYLLIVAFMISSFVGPALFLHMIPFFTDRGISADFAVIVVAVWSGSGAIGSLMFGVAAEKFSMRWTLTVGFLLNAIGYGLLLAVYSEWVAIVWGFYLGITGGGLFTLQQVVFADYYGRESLGSIRGVVWPIQMITNALGPLVAAIAYDITGNYVAVFASFGILIIFASLAVFGAKPPITTHSPEIR